MVGWVQRGREAVGYSELSCEGRFSPFPTPNFSGNDFGASQGVGAGDADRGLLSS